LIGDDRCLVREVIRISRITVHGHLFGVSVTVTITVEVKIACAINVLFLSFSQTISIEVLFPVIGQVDGDDCGVG